MSLQLIDAFLIAVPSVFDEGTGPLKHTNTAFFIDKERDRYERKITKGVIHRIPVGYSEERHMPIDEGIPNYKRYIGHDAIQQKANEGMGWGNEKYHPGAHEGWQYVSREDYGKVITAREGDVVFFHPAVTEPDNHILDIPGYSVFKAEVHEIIAVLRDGVIIPQGFHVLVKPHEENTDRSGLSIAIEAEDLPLEGTVVYGRSMVGEVVYFQEGSDWSFDFIGTRLFAMLEENILGRKIA